MKCRIRPGHENKMTLVVIGATDKDKAQILEVTPAACAGSGLSPREACAEILKLLTFDLLGLTTPVARADWLPGLREAARHKATALAPASVLPG